MKWDETSDMNAPLGFRESLMGCLWTDNAGSLYIGLYITSVAGRRTYQVGIGDI